MSFNALLQDVDGCVDNAIALNVRRSVRSTFDGVSTPSPGPRGKAAKLASREQPNAVGPWIACNEPAGVIEIHDSRLLVRGREAFCFALMEAAVARFGAYRAEVWLEKSTCRLEFGPGRFDRAEMARRAASSVAAATPSVHERAGSREDSRSGGRLLATSATVDGTSAAIRVLSDGPSDPEATHDGSARRGRLMHMAIAGGSFAMAIGAVILPGIPTLPFLIMTGRHAVLISPRIERLIKRYPWCAALLAEIETSSSPTLDWPSLLKMAGLTVIFVAGIWLLQPPLPVILVLELGLMAFIGWREWGGSDHAGSHPGALA